MVPAHARRRQGRLPALPSGRRVRPPGRTGRRGESKETGKAYDRCRSDGNGFAQGGEDPSRGRGKRSAHAAHEPDCT